jgi:death-on-curing protein
VRHPVWVDREALLRQHEESLVLFGGAPGIRDAGLLDSALARPQQLFAYGTPDLADLAAAYAFGVARNHAFVDGNKRAAFLALGMFLAANDVRLVGAPADATRMMLAVAAGEVAAVDLAAWVRAHAHAESAAPPPDA